MIIRTIREADAPAFLELCMRLDDETRFMLLEPGERTLTPRQQADVLRAILAHENSTLLLAEHDRQLVGYIEAIGGGFRRDRHSAHIVVGILQAFTGQGVGTRLFTEVERWARGHGIHRLSLTVMTHNERGLALYRKMGFHLEGTHRHALVVEGAYVDEYSMAKLLT